MVVKKKPVRIPRIEFRYSWVYDQDNKLRFTDPLYPSGERIREYIEELKSDWSSMQRKIMGSISRTSGLTWREETIICYVVGRGVPMSDPLTIPIYEGQPDTFIEKMIYELIERMVMHPKNLSLRSGFWESMFRSMADDGVKVSYMVPVNAIFSEIHSRYLGSSDEGSRSLMSTNLDYKRAWEIVKDMGHSGIIERFRRGEWD